MPRPKGTQLHLAKRSVYATSAELDSRNRIKLPNQITQLTGILRDEPKALVFRLLEAGQVSCAPLDARVSGILADGFESDDYELSEAMALTFFRGAIHANENRVYVPEEVSGFLLSHSASKEQLWLVGWKGRLEIWNGAYQQSRLRIASSPVESFLDLNELDI